MNPPRYFRYVGFALAVLGGGGLFSLAWKGYTEWITLLQTALVIFIGIGLSAIIIEMVDARATERERVDRGSVVRKRIGERAIDAVWSIEQTLENGEIEYRGYGSLQELIQDHDPSLNTVSDFVHAQPAFSPEELHEYIEAERGRQTHILEELRAGSGLLSPQVLEVVSDKQRSTVGLLDTIESEAKGEEPIQGGQVTLALLSVYRKQRDIVVICEAESQLGGG